MNTPKTFTRETPENNHQLRIFKNNYLISTSANSIEKLLICRQSMISSSVLATVLQ